MTMKAASAFEADLLFTSALQMICLLVQEEPVALQIKNTTTVRYRHISLTLPVDLTCQS